MKTYQIYVAARAYVGARVQVQAEDEQQAMALALVEARAGRVAWEVNPCDPEDLEVDAYEAVKS